MQKMGFKLSAEDIYDINHASMKDAVVLFGTGCTGELISGDGLLITNHHCGFGQIQKAQYAGARLPCRMVSGLKAGQKS